MKLLHTLAGLLVLAIIGLASPALAQDSNPAIFSRLFLNTDASNNLVVVARANAGGQTLTSFPRTYVKTDASNQLIETLASGSSLGSSLFADGTSGAPSIAFASETTLGFWRNASAQVTLQGSFNVSSGISIGTSSNYSFATRGGLGPLANGIFDLHNAAGSIGSAFKVDALPTIASGFGTSPAVTAGSTPLAGSINVGTGGTATTGTITFGGTAFPSTPFCTYSNTTSNLITRGAPTTTTLVLNTTTAWTASDVVTWHCISAK